jgi:hypothetical protein
MDLGSIVVLLKLLGESEGLTTEAPQDIEYLSVGDKCPQFGKALPDGTVCIYGKVQPRLD